MSDVQRVELRTTDGAGPLVASASGAVVPSSSPDLLHGLVKLLGEGEPVLVDISGLQLDWAPADGVSRVQLNAVAEARTLYERMGFGPPSERLMELRISDRSPP